MQYRTITPILIIFFLTSCTSKEKHAIDVFGISEIKDSKITFSSILGDLTIFPVIQESKAIPYSPTKIIPYKDFLIILDRSSSKIVTLFNLNTWQSRTIGKIGRGPGEFLSPDDMCLDRLNNELIILDRVQRKLIYYSLNNFDVIREKTFSFPATRFIKANNFYYFLSGRGIEKLVLVTNKELSIVNKFLDKDIRHTFKAIDSFYKINDQVVYYTPFSPILHYFKNGQQVKSRFIHFASNNFTKKELQTMPNISNGKQFLSLVNDYNTLFQPVVETKHLIYFSYVNSGKRSLVFYNKDTGQSLNTFQHDFINDLTFEDSVPMILSADENGYFYAFTFISDTNKAKLIRAFSHKNINFEKTIAIIIRFKIDFEKFDKLSLKTR